APPEWERYRREVARGIRSADRVIAPSRAMLSALDRFYGPLPRGTRVIPNGRDPRRFRTRRKEPFILSAGRLWDEAKNTRVLDTLAARLPWPIYLAGEAQHPNGSSV